MDHLFHPYKEKSQKMGRTTDRRSSPHNNNNAVTPSITKVMIWMSARTKAVVKFTYEPALEDELGLTKGDYVYVVEKGMDGWWKGEDLNGTVGWFPSNYVKEVDPATYERKGTIEKRYPRAFPPPPAAAMQPPPQQQKAAPTTRTSLEVVVALYSFDASSSEELSFNKGERLEIVAHPEHDSDWWQARNAHGNIGLVPRNYIQVVNQSLSSTQDFAPQLSGKAETLMEHEPWFFGRISRDRAEELLHHGREGEFLVRDSESNPGDLSISMRGQTRIMHFEVQKADGQYSIWWRKFDNMDALISHHSIHPIFSPIDDGLYLTGPLPK